MHSTGTGQPVETQDVFFWRLAGRSAPTGLAIVHWIGCINAIKIQSRYKIILHHLSTKQMQVTTYHSLGKTSVSITGSTFTKSLKCYAKLI